MFRFVCLAFFLHELRFCVCKLAIAELDIGTISKEKISAYLYYTEIIGIVKISYFTSTYTCFTLAAITFEPRFKGDILSYW